MTRKISLTALVAATALGACSSGDINIDPSTNVTDSNNTTVIGGGGSANDICASYVNTGGQTIQGVADGDNCTYGPSFASNVLPLKVDMTVPALPNGGAHIFGASLFVGESYRSDAELAAAGISEGGDGPTLTIEAGATIAFKTSKDFLVVNRGSRIVAVGRADAPITITSESDVLGTVGPEDVQQWGGMVIDGFGVTNKCAYTGTRGQPGFALVGECHVDSEGSSGNDENQYGGDNDDDSSGQLEYFIVKHTGATVGNGDELNGITFGAVGRNTIVRNLEAYSTYDDGIEMFGGAVSFENYLAVYVRDDSIDIDEGWSGTITNALVIQSETDGNHCIEADGIGDYDNLTSPVIEDIIARNLQSAPVISNLTCIISANGAATATHDPGAGWRLREGVTPTINDSIVIATYGPTDGTSANDNYCLRIDNRSQQAALDGVLQLNSVLWSCGENTRGQTLAGTTITEQAFATNDPTYGQGGQFATIVAGAATSPTAVSDTELQLMGGTYGSESLPWNTSLIDNAAPVATSEPSNGPGESLGALAVGGADWTAGWSYGIDPNNRGEALWIEGL